MRYPEVLQRPMASDLRVLLIDGTEKDHALVISAIGPHGEIVRVSSQTPAFDAQLPTHDVALIGRGARAVGPLLRLLKNVEPHRPVILLTDDVQQAAELDFDGRATGAEDTAAALIGGLARVTRARAAEIEALRHAEIALRRREEQTRFLVALGDAARSADTPEEIAEFTMRLLRKTLEADLCIYADVDPEGTSFTCAAVAAAHGVPTIGGRFPLTEAQRTALLDQHPSVVDDLDSARPEWASPPMLDQTAAKAWIIAPLVKGERLEAFAGVYMLSPRRWQQDEIELVAAATERLWEAMELARVSRALRDREREFRLLFELSAVGVAQSDPATGRFVRVNPRFCELTGYTEDEILRLTFHDVTHPDDREANAEAIARVLRGEADRWDIEKRYVRPNGSIVWAQVSGQLMKDREGKPYGVIANAADITDRKHAEAAQREADRRKDEFLAVLGHELRNPLAPLKAGIELLREAQERPSLLQKLRGMMERQLAHLIHLVDDLLDLARVTRGEVELQRAALDLRDVVSAAVELGMPLIAERRHALDVDLATHPLPVEGDFQRLTQVIGNLLSNAAKYTEPGGRIEVRGSVEGAQTVVRVCDTGYGIPPERLEYVFEMFGQVPEHRTKTGGGGIGIGLALSRQLVTLHGGKLEARSEGLGKGSEFIVTLPSAPLAKRKEVRMEPTDRPRGAKRVLIIDDNVDAAESLRMVLELEGHVAETAHGAIDGLTAFERFEPEVVLLDIGLPEMDGYEVARRMRALPRGPAVALYALTGWAQEEDKRRAFEAGFDEHLTKPVDAATLRQLIAAGPPGR